MKPKTILTLALSAVALIALVSFAATEWVSKQEIDQVVVNLDESGNHFVDEEGLRNTILSVVEENRDSVTNTVVDLELLERELLRYSFVKEVQASRDIRGNLVIDVEQDEPIARVMSPRGKGAYISRQRNLLPLSKKYTARVMLITGAGADSLLSETFLAGRQGVKIAKLIDYINQDEFLSSQITQLEISKWMGITLHPQVGSHRIEFGKADDFDRKFSKLATFYKKIVPKKGWNEYKTIKLQFEGQIVCK